MRKINKLGRRAAALVLAVGLTLSTAAPVLAADADEVQTPAAQTEQQETDTEADEADVDTEADEAAALPEQPDVGGFEPIEESELKPVVDAQETDETQQPGLVEPDVFPGPGSFEPIDESELKPTDDGAELYAWKPHKGSCSRDVLLETQAATCTTPERKKWKCLKNGHFNNWWEENTAPALGHDMSDWIVVEATCTTAGEKYKVCQRSGCNYKVVEEGYAEAHPALGHDFEGAEWIIEPATCTTPGKRYQVCQHEGCTEEKVDPTYAEEHPALNHVWGKYVDDDKPGCEQQTETAHCTREGCTATDTEDRPNFGADGNPLPHKYTKYEVSKEFLGVATEYISTCDYGCGTTKTFGALNGEIVADKTTDATIKNVKLDGKTADAYADAVIDKALQNAQEAVKNAKTKEEALAALDQIFSTVKSELSSVKITVAGVGGDVTISQDDLNKALAPLDSTIADLKSSLNDSFLSQDTIINMVDKLAGDVQDSSAPQAGIKQILHNTVYDAIYNIGKADNEKKTTDNTQAISDMVLQLVKEVVQSDKGWNDLTGSLVDDAVDLAVDELMKDETYAKLLKTKLGAATMEEVRAEVKKQLVEDPEFMNQVRGIAGKAVNNAQKGVNAGWSNEKIMNRLQADLLPDVTDLISNQVNKLGASAGDIVDNKVSDTVHKFLPGKLGDWVSDKIGGKVNDAVTGKVDDLNKQVTDLISTTIKQLTCTHQYESFTVESTCTQKGKTGEICKKCGKTRNTKDIEELAPHTPVVDAAVAPTETSDGLTEGSHCSVCGAVLQAQEVIPMRDPTIDTWFSRAATTEADAKAAGFDSVDAANAALDAALTAAGFDPANAEHFTVQVNSSIGVLPNDRFSESGVTGKLTLPEGTRGKTAQTYYAVQMFTADTRFHKAGDVVVTPVSIDTYAKTGLQFTVYSEAVMAIAWKAQ